MSSDKRQYVRWRHAAIAMVSGLATLFVIEGGFRIRSAFVRELRWRPGEVYATNPRGYFRPCGDGLYCPNRDRSSHACEAAPIAGKPQLLYIGDSFTFGAGVDAIDSYSSRVQLPGYQRHNCAESGFNIWDIHRKFLENTAHYRPALTIYGLVLNDFGIDIPDSLNSAEFSRYGGPHMISDYVLFRT